MAKPTDISMQALRRLGRYLLGKRRLIFNFHYQDGATLETYSDTDWGGCLRTRKSTSGGCLMLGGHTLKTWSSTQQSVSLSSGEAEFYGVVRASGVALGQQSLFRDLGYVVPVRVWTDSSAAIGICQRQGLGRLRHIDTQALWIQQQVREKAIEFKSVRGEVNPADLFTKFLLSKARVEGLVKLFNCEFRDGRAESAPQLRKVDTGERDGDVRGGVDPQGELEMCDGDVMAAADDVDYGEHVPEAKLHNIHVLPHMHSNHDVEIFFPKADAGDCIEDFPDFNP